MAAHKLPIAGRHDRARLGGHLDHSRARGGGGAGRVPALLPRTAEGRAADPSRSRRRRRERREPRELSRRDGADAGRRRPARGEPAAAPRTPFATRPSRGAGWSCCRSASTSAGPTRPHATLAEPIPGPHADVLVHAAAREHRVFVAAGLVERAGDRLFNAAVLIAPDGRDPASPPQDQRTGHRPRPLLRRRPAGRRRDGTGHARPGDLRGQLRLVAGGRRTSWRGWARR